MTDKINLLEIMTHDKLKTILSKLSKEEEKELLTVLRVTANSHYFRYSAASLLSPILANTPEHERLEREAYEFMDVINYANTERGYIKPVPTIPIKPLYVKPL